MTKPKLRFGLRFPINRIPEYAGRFSYPKEKEEKVLWSREPEIQPRGYLTKDELRLVAQWKSPRSARHMENNDNEYVKAVTKVALSTPHKEMKTEAHKLLDNKPQYRQYSHERLRIEVLTLLKGVGCPTASVILLFFHRSKYPIIDVRALWSVSKELKRHEYPDHWEAGSSLSFSGSKLKRHEYPVHWEEYTKYCRYLADSARVSMRTLDKALWQYSKEHQPPKTQ